MATTQTVLILRTRNCQVEYRASFGWSEWLNEAAVFTKRESAAELKWLHENYKSSGWDIYSRANVVLA